MLDHFKKWVKACGCVDVTLNNVTRDTYICTKHFYREIGTFEYQDPLQYGITGPEMEQFIFKIRKKDTCQKLQGVSYRL